MEPFCGMCSVFAQFVTEYPIKQVVLSDRNPYLIKLLKGLKNGYRPVKKCSREKYDRYIRRDSTSLDALYTGFACAYRGDFRSTFFPNNNMETQREAALQLGDRLRESGAQLSVGEYDKWKPSTVRNTVIYCDPPYEGTQCPYCIGNEYARPFDLQQFLIWCREMARHNAVYVSEYKKFSLKKDGMKLIWSRGKQKLYRVVSSTRPLRLSTRRSRKVGR